jgi:hypothetical protein
MVYKKDFIARIFTIMDKDLNKILPNEGNLDEMYEKLGDYLKEKFI